MCDKILNMMRKVLQMKQMMVIMTTLAIVLMYFLLAMNYVPMLFMTYHKGHPNLSPATSHQLGQHSKDSNDTNGSFMVSGERSYSFQDENEEVEESKYRGKAPPVILLWTTWRSGSTYLGEMLAKSLKYTFYSTEPLHYWKVNILHDDDAETQEARSYLHDLLHCRLRNYLDQVTYMSRQGFYKKWNAYLFRMCKPRKACDDPYYVSEVCREADVHIGKVLSLSLKWAWSLLQDDGLNLKIIFSVRDPRAVLLSRSRVGWCKSSTCRDPKVVCDLLEDDLMQVNALTQNFPNRFKFMQYERFTENPELGLKDMMSFAQLPVSRTHLALFRRPHGKPGDLYSTKKNPKTQSQLWRSTGKYEDVRPIQRACRRPLEILSLRIFQSESEFRNVSLPLLVNEPSINISH